MRKLVLVTAALVVAVIFFCSRRSRRCRRRHERGRSRRAATHRSPGVSHSFHAIRRRGDKDAIAAAAARAGLPSSSSPIMATARDRRTRRQYLHGVLCVDGVEISTNGGHYVALDMRPAPIRSAASRRGRRGCPAARRLRDRGASGFAAAAAGLADWTRLSTASSG